MLVSGEAGVSNPKWSPDGTRIAMTVSPDYGGTQDIRVITTKGGAVWGTGTGNDAFLDWKPDQTRILGAQRYPLLVYTVDVADGTGRTPIADQSFGGPWSPDGTKFVHMGLDSTQRGYDIYTENTDGTGKSDVTNSPGVDETDPDWQPLHGPQRSDYKNAAQFCKAERGFLGDAAFEQKYGGNANAYGKCVTGK